MQKIGPQFPTLAEICTFFELKKRGISDNFENWCPIFSGEDLKTYICRTGGTGNQILEKIGQKVL